MAPTGVLADCLPGTGLEPKLRTYVRLSYVCTYVHLDVCARMPCMHTYASTRARTCAQRKRRKEMWRRRMAEAHHSHPPRNVRTYVRTYVPTYARTYARTYVHLDACARMPCMRMRTYAQRNRRKEMWRRRMTEAHHSHPPPTHARTYARCTYVRTYVFSVVRTIFEAILVLGWPRWPG